MSIVARSSATSIRHALMAMSCVALANAPIPASSENMPSCVRGSRTLMVIRIAPSSNCIGTIHCLRRPSRRNTGMFTLSISGDQRNWKA